jgi:hypothetical protein
VKNGELIKNKKKCKKTHKNLHISKNCSNFAAWKSRDVWRMAHSARYLAMSGCLATLCIRKLLELDIK